MSSMAPVHRTPTTATPTCRPMPTLSGSESSRCSSPFSASMPSQMRSAARTRRGPRPAPFLDAEDAHHPVAGDVGDMPAAHRTAADTALM